MDELLRHLREDKYWEAFEGGEFTNPTRFLYTAVWCAVRDGADVFVITLNGFRWYKNELLLGTHLGSEGDPVPTPFYSDIMRIVLKRDGSVQQHFAIVAEKPGETIVEIT